MGLRMLGLGTAAPRYDISQEDAAAASLAISPPPRPETQRTILKIFQKTQVQRRGSVVLEHPEGSEIRQSFFLPSQGVDDGGPTTARRMRKYAEHAGGLALQAACEALDQSGVAAGRVTHLVTNTCTGFAAPGVDLALIEGLGLRTSVARTQIGFMGCHGLFNGLRAADAFAARPGSCVLTVAVELCSLHFHYAHGLERVVANALFADGAAAAVGSSAEAPPLLAESDACPWTLRDSASEIFPNSADAMTWTIGNHGFVMTLSAAVPDLIAARLRPWVEKWLAGNGLSIAQIGGWAVHPGGPRIVTAAGAALGLPAEALADSNGVLADYGNMSSPTIAFVLKRLRERNVPRPWVALGFGPGLAVEGMLFD